MEGRKRNMSPAAAGSEETYQNATTFINRHRPVLLRQRPVCPEPPSFAEYAITSPETYRVALKKYTQNMEQFRLDVKRYDEQELVNLEINTGYNFGGSFGCDDHYFNPGFYAGGIDFSHTNSNSDRHNVTIDGEGRIQVSSRSNISTYSKDERYYWVEVGVFMFKLSKTIIKGTWGYVIEIETKEFKPYIHTRVDSKDRIKILISAYFECKEPEVEELCLHLINSKKIVQLYDMWIAKELYDTRIIITTPF